MRAVTTANNTSLMSLLKFNENDMIILYVKNNL